jgi:hypothetical protein
LRSLLTALGYRAVIDTGAEIFVVTKRSIAASRARRGRAIHSPNCRSLSSLDRRQ